MMKTQYQIFDANGVLVRTGRMILLSPSDLKGSPVEIAWSEGFDLERDHYVESYVYVAHPKIVLTNGERVVIS